MRTRVLLILFIFITSFSYNVNAENTRILNYKENIKIPSSTSGGKNVEVKKDKDKDNSKNKFKVTKKDLKTEIKQRKKYHKSLLSIYNESFDPKYLELIQSNSSRLSSLRELL